MQNKQCASLVTIYNQSVSKDKPHFEQIEFKFQFGTVGRLKVS